MKLLYRGYVATVLSSDRIGALFGEVSVNHDVIAFQATSVNEVEAVFQRSVEEYLTDCHDLGLRPELPLAA